MMVYDGLTSTLQNLSAVCLDDVLIEQNKVHRVVKKNLDQKCYASKLSLKKNVWKITMPRMWPPF